MPDPMTPEIVAARKQMAAEILDLLDDGELPGSPIRWRGEEIWLHTTGQVEGWLRTWFEREQITSANDSERIADLEEELAQVRADRDEAHRLGGRHRTDAERAVRERDRLAAAARPALESLDMLIRDHSDPGTQALADRHNLAQALITVGPGPGEVPTP